MRELRFESTESDGNSLVFTSDSSADGAQEQFFLALDTLSPQDIEALASALESSRGRADVSTVEASAETVTAGDDVASSPAIPAAEPVESPRSQPLKLRPKEIQERIRAGATVEEVAELAGVSVERIDDYAYPVLLERSRMAEIAKKAYPVRDDGPAKLTLWEILATAFAARGIDLESAEWDSYRDASNQWVVSVSWKAGLSENTAEWSLHTKNFGQSTAVARNAIAADVIDPEFIQPVRKVNVHRPRPSAEDTQEMDLLSELTGIVETPAAGQSDAADASAHDGDAAAEQSDSRGAQREGQEPSSKRRRKAVTPHWEDVLLGVRANTKRPRN